MTPRQRIVTIQTTYTIFDVICVYFAIYLSCALNVDKLSFPVSFTHLLLEPTNPFRFIFVFWILTTILINRLFNLYETRREVLEGVEIWNVIRSVGIASLAVIASLYVLKIGHFPRSIFVMATVTMVALLSIWRVLKRIFVEYLVVSGYNNWNALIVGAGKVGVALSQELSKRPNLGIRVVGFLDDFKTGLADDHKHRVVGKISDFTALAPKEFVSMLFITVHHDSQVFIKLLEDARDMNVTVRVIPQGYGVTASDFRKYNIGLIPILEYSNVDAYRRQFGKRLFDILSSLVLLIPLSVVFLAIALAIKLDSPGPIFYYSRRYGRKGRLFKMIKFRSMVSNAEGLLDNLKCRNEVDGPIFKIKRDPRITKFGRFLRKYSLDELPQLLNVFLGDMSLVGPRPLPMDQVEKEDLRQLKRLEVRPGITGLWQVRGRSDISFSRLVRWDVWYINNWSFWLDLNILWQTFPVVIKGKGAY